MQTLPQIRIADRHNLSRHQTPSKRQQKKCPTPDVADDVPAIGPLDL